MENREVPTDVLEETIQERLRLDRMDTADWLQHMCLAHYTIDDRVIRRRCGKCMETLERGERPESP